MKKPPPNSFHRSFSAPFNSSIFLILLLCFPLYSMAESVGCDDAHVQLDNNALVINVATTGVDDTVNIQCALDVAVSDGYPIVRLAAGTYFISSLIVENFKGTLEGKTKTSTIIEVLDNSINCGAMESNGLSPSAIKFVKGEPRIRFMTINADRSCTNGFGVLNILHFTGQPASPENCDNDVIFGVVDRVIIDRNSSSIGGNAIAVAAESVWLIGGCTDTLLGTFKLNRSLITNASVAVSTALKAGGQVDINFNEFRDNRNTINIRNSNQNTTISTNKFFNEDISGGEVYDAINIRMQGSSAPAQTRAVIHKNEFNMQSQMGGGGAVITMVNFASANISSVITENQFNLAGDGVSGIISNGVSNTHVSANRFSGNGEVAVWLFNEPASGLTITANMGLKNFTSLSFSGGDSDIVLSAGSSQCIVGPGQGAGVTDLGSDNTVLPQ